MDPCGLHQEPYCALLVHGSRCMDYALLSLPRESASAVRITEENAAILASHTHITSK